jgi:hypothetical protein
MSPASNAWPALGYEPELCLTLRLWTQVVGKIRLAKTPWINHSWHVVLYPTVRGLTTSPIHDGARTLQLDFDFVEHALVARSAEGEERRVPLKPRTVADFYGAVLAAVRGLGFEVELDPHPSELPDGIPFPEDTVHRAYDPDFANRHWRVLLASHRVLQRFRSGFLGKVSPIHFFWGSFDLAVTRFSGRRAPLHPGGSPGLPDDVTREAYSHEVSSAGFWPGSDPILYPAFYSYAYPEPDGFAERRPQPAAAEYNADLGQFLLPYEAVRSAADPDAALLAFLESTYAAAADTGGWDRAALECELGQPGVPRRVE